MFINFYSSFFLISFFILYVLLGCIFILFGYFLGLYGFDFFSSNRFFECGFISNDNIFFNNTTIMFEVCFIFLVLEIELIFITIFIMYFSFSSFLFFSILFSFLSFIVVNDFILFY